MISVEVQTNIQRGAHELQPGAILMMDPEEAKRWGANRPGGAVRFASDEDRDLFHELERKALTRLLMPPSPRANLRQSVPRTRVAWVQDTLPGIARGAELSNKRVCEVGQALGFDIQVVYPQSWDDADFEGADVVILNNLRNFSAGHVRKLIDVIWERAIPYVRYEHTMDFCWERGRLPCDGDTTRCEHSCSGRRAEGELPVIQWYRAQYTRALLSVFISPMQRDLHERALGRCWDREFLLTPPIDPDTFRPVGGVAREDKLAVVTSGHLPESKGRGAVLEWARQHPDWRVEIYARRDGRVDRELEAKVAQVPNAEIVQAVPLRRLPEVYSRASLLLFLPADYDAAGRTPVEAALCGCAVEMSDRAGVKSFDLPLGDRDALAERIEAGPYGFWRAVEEALHAH